MKKLFTLSFLLILGFAALSQEISVKSFRALPNDLDARVSYPKEDKNGEKAAIIKVVTTETGFDFDGGIIGIIAAVPKISEIWLYVPNGSKVVTIKHPKLGLLRNYPYPLPIETGQVYEMVLTTGKVITTIEAPTIETQWLLISSDPSGADVYINDQPAGKTPYQNELPSGKYSYRVSKELYLPEAGTVELSALSDKQKVNVKMKPNFGTLNITSSPENGAKVILNDMPTGKVTPCSIEMVKSGTHMISLSLDMYETTDQQVTLVAGETKQVTVKMNPTFSEVKVTSEPAADIYINGQMKSTATWQGRLNPGVYTFEARLDKYVTATEKQTVIVGQPLNINLSPTPKTGNLKIMTTPFEATIKIDGKEIGKTPITLRNQLIGDYTIELSLEGYATAYEKTTIGEGQTAEINVTLQNGMQVNINSDPSVSDLFIDDKPVGKTPYNGNLSFGSHNLRIENNGMKVEKGIQLAQEGAKTFFIATKSLNGSFTDYRDGKTYKTVRIGNQTWMAENLNFNNLNSWCNQCETYGRLYNYEAALTSCPSGWHLPSDDEWSILMSNCGGENVAGGKRQIKGGMGEWDWIETFEYILQLPINSGLAFKNIFGFYLRFSMTHCIIAEELHKTNAILGIHLCRPVPAIPIGIFEILNWLFIIGDIKKYRPLSRFIFNFCYFVVKS